jgi:DNA-directed RNA polymerase subunit RPC12/RpoP
LPESFLVMSTSIICPDCGGIVGATERTPEGVPCTCFQSYQVKDSPAPAHEEEDAAKTHLLDAPTRKQKICCMCGKDVSGKKRLRDSLGYWCMDCHRADQKKRKPVGIPCPKCGRIVKPETIVVEDNQKMCSRCYRELLDERRPGAKRFRAISFKAYDQQERIRLLILFGIFFALLLIILLKAMGWIGET